MVQLASRVVVRKNLLRNIVGNILSTAFLPVLLCFTFYDTNKQIQEVEHVGPFPLHFAYFR